MESRKLDEEPQITAQPKSISDALLTGPVAEPGLSVEPEDLGRHFLSEATEQANFESSMGGDTVEMYISDPAPSDDALVSPVWEEDRGLWQQTIERSLQTGGIDEVMFRGSPAGNDQTQGFADDLDDDADAVASSIRDVSLFDREGKRPGEVEAPDIETDEQAAQARRREAANSDELSAIRRPGGRGLTRGLTPRTSRRAVGSGRR